MISESSVRQRLLAVSRNQLSLEEFEKWLAGNSWNMHSDSSPNAIDLVSSIHLLLSERDDRVLNESQLRNELLSLLNNALSYVVMIHMNFDVVPNPPSLRVTANSSPVLTRMAAAPQPV